MTSVVLSGRVISPVSTSELSPAEDRTSLSDILLSRKQQRSMKLFLKRTARPLLRSFPPVSRGTTTKDPSTYPPPTPSQKELLFTVGDSDPLPLLAREEIARSQKSSRTRSPLASALHAVDWMASDLAKFVSMAQGVTFPEWPVRGGSKGKGRVVPVEEDAESKETEEEVTEEQRQVLEDLMFGPRCAWPKESVSTLPAQSAVASAVFSVGEYPRSAWPRKKAVRMFLSESESSPRCNWPRGSSVPAASPSAMNVTEAPPAYGDTGIDQTSIDSLERIWASEPNIASPHSAWPRKRNSLGQVAAPHSAWPRARAAGLTFNEEAAPGPRSAWPETKTAFAIGAHCRWPKAAGSCSTAPRCSYPRAELLTSSLETVTSASAVVAAPRCAFPKAGRMVAALATVLSPSLTSVEEIEMLGRSRCAYPQKAAVIDDVAGIGPRCGWPKLLYVVEKAHAIGEEERGMSVESSIRYSNGAINATAMALSSPLIRLEVPPSSPRCGWPRSQSPYMSPSFVSPGPVMSGARCAWPRTEGSVTPVSKGTRSTWPRRHVGSVHSLAEDMEAESPEVVTGPRCSWPKASSCKEESDSGPRCAWPKSQC